MKKRIRSIYFEISLGLSLEFFNGPKETLGVYLYFYVFKRKFLNLSLLLRSSEDSLRLKRYMWLLMIHLCWLNQVHGRWLGILWESSSYGFGIFHYILRIFDHVLGRFEALNDFSQTIWNSWSVSQRHYMVIQSFLGVLLELFMRIFDLLELLLWLFIIFNGLGGSYGSYIGLFSIEHKLVNLNWRTDILNIFLTTDFGVLFRGFAEYGFLRKEI